MLEQTLFVLMMLGLAIMALLFVIAMRLNELVRLQHPENWLSPAVKAYREGNFDEVIEQARAKLELTPAHVPARWYLAKAYYAKQMWAEAKQEFETVGQHEPTWRAKHVQPYLDEIAKRL